MKIAISLLLMLTGLNGNAQPVHYRVSHAHSHNDYEQRVPFWMAYHAGFGSIEADIFLMPGGVLQVAHDSTELKRNMTLEASYIRPLLSCLKKNKGYPYRDTSRKLQLLIDVKTDSVKTLRALITLLRKNPSLIQCGSLTWVITGNRPDPSQFYDYPPFIRFDGELYKNYSKAAISRISMFSDDFERYSHWDGKGDLPAIDDSLLTAAVTKAHLLKKPVRFWDAPDNAHAWKSLMGLRVDYLNTDRIEALKNFLQTRGDEN